MGIVKFTSAIAMTQETPKFIISLNHFVWFPVEVLPDWMKDVDARVQSGLLFGKSRGFIQSGDAVVVITGWKQGSGFTNTLRVVYVSDNLTDAGLNV